MLKVFPEVELCRPARCYYAQGGEYHQLIHNALLFQLTKCLKYRRGFPSYVPGCKNNRALPPWTIIFMPLCCVGLGLNFCRDLLHGDGDVVMYLHLEPQPAQGVMYM